MTPTKIRDDFRWSRINNSDHFEANKLLLTGLTPPQFGACPKTGPLFPTSSVIVCFVFSYDERWLLVFFILVEMITITISWLFMTLLKNFFFYNRMEYQTLFAIIYVLWYLVPLMPSIRIVFSQQVRRTQIQNINVRKHRRGNQKWTIKRQWKYRVHKTKTNKTKTQHNMYWTQT